MASDNEACCESDPNFAVICGFLEKFGVTCGLNRIDFVDLQFMLENNREVSQELIDLHVKLLRKARKSVSSERWERAIIKLCHGFCTQDAWEIERFGYKNARLSSKLRILKELLEMQFDYNSKFKNEVNKLSAGELRTQPLGRDRLGHVYWFQSDNSYQIRVYKEDPDEETWSLLAKDREGLVSLITQLNDGRETVLNEDSNSLESEKPVVDTGQIDSNSNSNISKLDQEETAPDMEEEKSKEEETQKRIPDKSDNDNSLSGLTTIVENANLNKEEGGLTEKEENDSSLSTPAPNVGIRIKPICELISSNVDVPKKPEITGVKEKYIRSDSSSSSVHHRKAVDSAGFDVHTNYLKRPLEEEEDLDEPSYVKRPRFDRPTLLGNKKKKSYSDEEEEEVSDEMEEPLMLVTGEGAGHENECGNLRADDSPIVGETIEESTMYFFGQGLGADCMTGNDDKRDDNQEQQTKNTICASSTSNADDTLHEATKADTAGSIINTNSLSGAKNDIRLGTIIDVRTNTLTSRTRDPKRISRWDVKQTVANLHVTTMQNNPPVQNNSRLDLENRKIVNSVNDKEESIIITEPDNNATPKQTMFFFGPGCLQVKPTISPLKDEVQNDMGHRSEIVSNVGVVSIPNDNTVQEKSTEDTASIALRSDDIVDNNSQEKEQIPQAEDELKLNQTKMTDRTIANEKEIAESKTTHVNSIKDSVLKSSKVENVASCSKDDHTRNKDDDLNTNTLDCSRTPHTNDLQNENVDNLEKPKTSLDSIEIAAKTDSVNVSKQTNITDCSIEMQMAMLMGEKLETDTSNAFEESPSSKTTTSVSLVETLIETRAGVTKSTDPSSAAEELSSTIKKLDTQTDPGCVRKKPSVYKSIADLVSSSQSTSDSIEIITEDSIKSDKEESRIVTAENKTKEIAQDETDDGAKKSEMEDVNAASGSVEKTQPKDLRIMSPKKTPVEDENIFMKPRMVTPKKMLFEKFTSRSARAQETQSSIFSKRLEKIETTRQITLTNANKAEDVSKIVDTPAIIVSVSSKTPEKNETRPQIVVSSVNKTEDVSTPPKTDNTESIPSKMPQINDTDYVSANKADNISKTPPPSEETNEKTESAIISDGSCKTLENDDAPIEITLPINEKSEDVSKNLETSGEKSVVDVKRSEDVPRTPETSDEIMPVILGASDEKIVTDSQTSNKSETSVESNLKSKPTLVSDVFNENSTNKSKNVSKTTEPSGKKTLKTEGTPKTPEKIVNDSEEVSKTFQEKKTQIVVSKICKSDNSCVGDVSNLVPDETLSIDTAKPKNQQPIEIFKLPKSVKQNDDGKLVDSLEASKLIIKDVTRENSVNTISSNELTISKGAEKDVIVVAAKESAESKIHVTSVEKIIDGPAEKTVSNTIIHTEKVQPKLDDKIIVAKSPIKNSVQTPQKKGKLRTPSIPTEVKTVQKPVLDKNEIAKKVACDTHDRFVDAIIKGVSLCVSTDKPMSDTDPNFKSRSNRATISLTEMLSTSEKVPTSTNRALTRSSALKNQTVQEETPAKPKAMKKPFPPASNESCVKAKTGKKSDEEIKNAFNEGNKDADVTAAEVEVMAPRLSTRLSKKESAAPEVKLLSPKEKTGAKLRERRRSSTTSAKDVATAVIEAPPIIENVEVKSPSPPVPTKRITRRTRSSTMESPDVIINADHNEVTPDKPANSKTLAAKIPEPDPVHIPIKRAKRGSGAKKQSLEIVGSVSSESPKEIKEKKSICEKKVALVRIETLKEKKVAESETDKSSLSVETSTRDVKIDKSVVIKIETLKDESFKQTKGESTPIKCDSSKEDNVEKAGKNETPKPKGRPPKKTKNAAKNKQEKLETKDADKNEYEFVGDTNRELRQRKVVEPAKNDIAKTPPVKARGRKKNKVVTDNNQQHNEEKSTGASTRSQSIKETETTHNKIEEMAKKNETVEGIATLEDIEEQIVKTEIRPMKKLKLSDSVDVTVSDKNTKTIGSTTTSTPTNESNVEKKENEDLPKERRLLRSSQPSTPAKGGEDQNQAGAKPGKSNKKGRNKIKGLASEENQEKDVKIDIEKVNSEIDTKTTEMVKDNANMNVITQSLEEPDGKEEKNPSVSSEQLPCDEPKCIEKKIALLTCVDINTLKAPDDVGDDNDDDNNVPESDDIPEKNAIEDEPAVESPQSFGSHFGGEDIEIDSSNDAVIIVTEPDPLKTAVDLKATEPPAVKPPMTLATFTLDCEDEPPVLPSSLRVTRKRAAQQSIDVLRDTRTPVEKKDEGANKRAKLKKRSVDRHLRRSIEEQKMQEISSSEEDENAEKSQPPKLLEKGSKDIGKRRGSTRSPRGGDSSVHSSDALSETSRTDTPPLSKERKPRKMKKTLMGLDISEETENIINAVSDIGVRQSRRIAQIKIKEEAERRKLEEVTLCDIKDEQRKRKGKKHEDKDYKLEKRKRNKHIPTEDETTCDAESDEKKKRKRKRKHWDPTKQFDAFKAWKSSSGSSSSEIEDEEEEIEEDDDHHYQLTLKSDHEFSPESDLEGDGEVQPLKRARTARKESSDADEEIDDCACQKCGKKDHPEWILLCDSCDSGWHCSCLRPALLVIPEGDWFCPPCQHITLVKNLEEQLVDFDRKINKREMETRRKERLAYVGISLDNVLPSKDSEEHRHHKYRRYDDDDNKGSSRDGESDDSESSDSRRSGSDSSSRSDSESEPIYQLRERRQAHSYRFHDYDALINSAIQDELEAVKGAGNQGRGKDIATIVNAEKEGGEANRLTNDPSAAQSEIVVGEGGEPLVGSADVAIPSVGTIIEAAPPVVPPNYDERHVDNESDEEIIRPVKRIIGKKKHRKLNSLDVSSDDDAESDEDFKGSSSSSSDEDFDDEDEYSGSGSSDDSRRRRRRKNFGPIRRSTRARISRYDRDFINDDDSNSGIEKARQRKKAKSIWDESESEESDRSWGRRKRKAANSKRQRSSGKPKKSKKKKKKRAGDDSDPEVFRKRPNIKFGGLNDDEEIGRRTRGKKINYLEALGTDSEEEIRRKPPRIEESEEEYNLHEDEDFKQQFNNDNEKDSDESGVENVLQDMGDLPPPKPKARGRGKAGLKIPRKPKEGLPPNFLTAMSDMSQPLNQPLPMMESSLLQPMMNQALLLGPSMMQDPDIDEEPNPIEQINKNVEEMNELEMEKMMEEEDYANRQLQLVALQIEKEKKRKEREAMRLMEKEEKTPKKRGRKPKHQSLGLNQADLSSSFGESMLMSTNNAELSEPPGISLPMFSEISSLNADGSPRKRRGRGKGKKTLAAEAAAYQPGKDGEMDMSLEGPTSSSSNTVSPAPDSPMHSSKLGIAAPPQPFSQSQPTPSVITRMLQAQPGQGTFPPGGSKYFGGPPGDIQLGMPPGAPGQFHPGASGPRGPYQQPAPTMPHYPVVRSGPAPPHRLHSPGPQTLPPMYHSHRAMDPSPSGGGPINVSTPNRDRNSPAGVPPPPSSSPLNKGDPTPPPPPYSRPPVAHFPPGSAGPRHVPMVPPMLQHRPSNMPPYHPGMPPTNYYGAYPPPSPLNNDDAPGYSNPAVFSEAYPEGGGPPPAASTETDETSGEFVGLVSYFSSQREDDLDT